MASKDSCCTKNPNEDSRESKYLEDEGAELTAESAGECCDTACAMSAVEEQCGQVARPSSEEDKDEKLLFASPTAGCCVDKTCSDNVDGNFIHEEESSCEMLKASSVDGEEKSEICNGKVQGSDSCCEREVGGLDGCCGGNEKADICDEDASEAQISERCLSSCCSEQATNVEVKDDAKDTGLNDNDKLGVGLDSCCEGKRTGTCSAGIESADSAANEDESADTGGCCSSTRSCGAAPQDGPNDLSERDTNEHETSFIGPPCKTSSCCNKEDAIDSSYIKSEKKGLLPKQNRVKRNISVSPTQLSSKVGSTVNYGSTEISASKSESDSFLTVRTFKYTQVPCSSNDDSDITAADAKVIPVLEPSLKKTKFRIQNICCGKEADMVSRELEPLNGITAVSVNVVGRVGFVHHDSNIITAADIVRILNKLHLGVSIMESSNQDDERALRKEVLIRLAGKCGVLVVVMLLFIVVIVARSHNYSWLKWLAITEIVIGAIPIIRKIIINVLKKIYIDINMLMMVAVVGTIALREWIEGATLVFVFAIAEVLQQYCVYKVQSAISGIMIQLPDKAVIADTGKSVPLDEIEIGTRIVVCAGERIGLDGKVVKGQAAVDESSITGEALPIDKGPGSTIYSGTIMQSGYLEIVTTSTSKTSTVSKVTQMVQEAQAQSSQTEKMMNSFAKIYTPLVLVTALLVFAIPAILAAAKVGKYESELHAWGIRALIVLLIACPCALLMSVPIPMVCGISTSARNGALVKSGSDMETLAKIDSMAFDKTGTLTEGRFRVVSIKEFRDDMKYNEMLELIAALEVKSSHPVASALVNHYSGCITDKIANFGTSVGLPDVIDFISVPGFGLKGSVSGYEVIVGNLKMLRQSTPHVPLEVEKLFTAWSDTGQTVIFCSIDCKLSLMIGLADTPRATAKMTVQVLNELGIASVILTGDCGGAAASVMQATGADNYVASMKPEDKLEWIRTSQKPSPKTRVRIAMVGDGVNDGPSLAAADVGIAIGACATALAIESAGVALMSDNLSKIPELVVLSRFTRRVVIQNIGIALAIKVVVVIATMTGNLALWMAVLSDVAGLLLVILNGIRPLFWTRRGSREFDKYKDTDGTQLEARVLADEWSNETEQLIEINVKTC